MGQPGIAADKWVNFSFQSFYLSKLQHTCLLSLDDFIPTANAALIISQRCLVEDNDKRKSTPTWMVINAYDTDSGADSRSSLTIDKLKTCPTNRTPYQWCLLTSVDMDPNILARIINFDQSDLEQGVLKLHDASIKNEPHLVLRMGRNIRWQHSVSYKEAVEHSQQIVREMFLEKNNHDSSLDKIESKTVYLAYFDGLALSLGMENMIFHQPTQQRAFFKSTKLNNVTYVASDQRYTSYLNSELTNTQFNNSNLEHNLFAESRLIRPQFNFSNMTRLSLFRCDVSGCTITQSIMNSAHCLNAKLHYALIESSKVEKMHLIDMDILDSNWLKTSLRQNIWQESQFKGSNFFDCDMQSSHWQHVSFRDCEIRNCNLSGTHIENCDLRGLTFKNSRVINMRFTGNIILTPRQHQQMQKAGLDFSRARLHLKARHDAFTLPSSTTEHLPANIDDCMVPDNLQATLTKLANFLNSSHVEMFYTNPNHLSSGYLGGTDHLTGEKLLTHLEKLEGSTHENTLSQTLLDILGPNSPLMNEIMRVLKFYFSVDVESTWSSRFGSLLSLFSSSSGAPSGVNSPEALSPQRSRATTPTSFSFQRLFGRRRSNDGIVDTSTNTQDETLTARRLGHASVV